MLSLLLPILAGALAGASTGGLLAWYFLRHRQVVQPEVLPSTDPWLDAEIDRAAATWATEHGRPEAAPLMADKLRLLHLLGSRGASQ